MIAFLFPTGEVTIPAVSLVVGVLVICGLATCILVLLAALKQSSRQTRFARLKARAYVLATKTGFSPWVCYCVLRRCGNEPGPARKILDLASRRSVHPLDLCGGRDVFPRSVAEREGMS